MSSIYGLVVSHVKNNFVSCVEIEFQFTRFLESKFIENV